MPDRFIDRTPLDYPLRGTSEDRLRDAEAGLRAAIALGSLGSILAFGAGLLIGWVI